MSLISRSTMPTELVEGIKDHYGVGYREAPMFHRTFFDVVTSNKEVERYQAASRLGLHKVKPEGANSELDTIVYGQPTFIENLMYSLSYQITHEALADNLYPRILEQALDLGRSARETQETAAATFLEANGTLANGETLFSLTQPLFATGGETTQNRPTTPASLSEAALVIDISNIRRIPDPRGNIIQMSPESLLVPVEKEVTAFKLMNTELSVGTANNDLNPMRMGAKTGFFPKGLFVSSYLQDPNQYYIRTNQRGLKFQMREEPNVLEQPLVRALVQEVVSGQRFGIGVDDFRSVYANPGQ